MFEQNLKNFCWPLPRLCEGIEELARIAGLNPVKLNSIPISDYNEPDRNDLSRWIEWVGNNLSIESEPVETTVPQFKTLLSNAGPAIIQISHQGEVFFIFIINKRFGKLNILSPDLAILRCSIETLDSAVIAPYETPLVAEVDYLLTLAGIPAKKRQNLKSLMLRERLANKRIRGCWLLRVPPSASFRQQVSQAQLIKCLITIVFVFFLLYGIEIIGWGLMGHATLSGRLDLGWLSAWALLLFTLIPLQLLGRWLNSNFAIEIGQILKKRLLAGALNMDIEMLKHQGAGKFMSQVMESQVLESLALNGGFAVFIAAVELVLAGYILANGAGGLLHVVLLLIWICFAVALCWQYYRRLKKWTDLRLTMTHDLVEQMVGHRTRLAQELFAKTELQEDQVLQDYLAQSKLMDNAILPVVGGLPRGWLILSFAGMAPAFIYGLNNTVGIAVSLGGILLGYRAFSEMVSGLTAISRAVIAWRQVSDLFHAANTKSVREPFITSGQFNQKVSTGDASKLIEASELVFRYQPGSEPVIQKVSLTINQDERILLMGDSGGGKSTLASLLAGIRHPDSGLLLLNGLDHATLGENWHRLVTVAPQYHENHILTGTLAFNLLMGRNWPPSDGDLEEAYELCVELGLADVLARMPSGMMQMVGETGWQLSHGERSRIFLARALLQNTQLTILDESFAALDPESMNLCLTCVFKRAQTLLVIAHP